MQSVNVDPLNPAGSPSPAALHDLGVGGVRLVLRPACLPYIETMRASGLGVLGVIANESGDPEQYISWPVSMLQVGNEMDGSGPSSWTMTPAEFYALWYWCAELFPNVPRIIGGLCSGSVARGEQYLAVEGAAGFAVHPYGRDASSASDLIAAYREVTGYRNVYITEWNRPADQIAEYVAMLERETAGGWWFCHSDGMVYPYGLVTALQEPKPEYHELRRVLHMPEFLFGNAELAAQLGADVVGEALTDEIPFSAGNTIQATSKGAMMYFQDLPNQGVQGSMFFPKAEPGQE